MLGEDVEQIVQHVFVVVLGPANLDHHVCDELQTQTLHERHRRHHVLVKFLRLDILEHLGKHLDDIFGLLGLDLVVNELGDVAQLFRLHAQLLRLFLKPLLVPRTQVALVIHLVRLEVHVFLAEAGNDLGHPAYNAVVFEDVELLEEVLLLDRDVVVKPRLQVELAEFFLV